MGKRNSGAVLELRDLQKRLEHLSLSLKQDDKELLHARLNALISVFPFNEYEYTLMFLRDKAIITFDDYEVLREEYISSNKYLNLYGLAPRIFGEIWAHQHLIDLDPRFTKASKEIDRSFSGEYDLSIDGVKVEVKSGRAIHTKKRGDLVSKALHNGSLDPFWMNFQQLKPDMCDVFIFIGVWVDRILYWVLSSEEVKANPYTSSQHRGGIEVQIGIRESNIRDFDKYLVDGNEIGNTVLAKVGRGFSSGGP